MKKRESGGDDFREKESLCKGGLEHAGSSKISATQVSWEVVVDVTDALTRSL